MNKNLLFIVGAVVLIAVGYLIFANTQQTPQPVQEVTEEIISPEAVVVLSEQNNSGESGTATLVEEDGQVRVTLSLTGAPEDVNQPAHIHAGACPDVGEVTYPLASPVNGESETMLEVSMEQLKAQMPLAVNVHKSAQESGVYVACGDLEL